MNRIGLVGLLFLSLAACGDTSYEDWNPPDTVGQGGPSSETPPLTVGGQIVVAAKETIPTMLDLHTTVFQRTCSPDGGVCHNSKEYPDLHTAGNLLDSIWKPCNLAESKSQGVVDMCEPPGEWLEILTGTQKGFKTRIAWTAPEDSRWVITLEAPIPGECWPHVAGFRIVAGDGSNEVLLELFQEILEVKCGQTKVYLNYFNTFGPELQDALQWRVQGGDPNRNGVFGYDFGGALIVPGELERSYLLLRMLGVVPGTPMPLANQPLDDKEWLALMCWIETLSDTPSVMDVIDYDGCEAAKTVIKTGELPEISPVEVWP